MAVKFGPGGQEVREGGSLPIHIGPSNSSPHQVSKPTAQGKKSKTGNTIARGQKRRRASKKRGRSGASSIGPITNPNPGFKQRRAFRSE